MNKPILLSSIAMMACALALPAPACTLESGPGRAALLELYTSEGCSSCPPADSWLGRLPAQGYTLNRVVPLALHVDYWDYIGWHDSFAKPIFGERQRSRAGLGFVYTPQVMLDGQDFRGWRNPSFAQAVAAINRSAPGADINLTVTHPVADQLQIKIAVHAPADASLYIALYENGLTTQVKSGENSGATLHHDYVVREWLGPYPAVTGKTVEITLKPGWKKQDLGIAAFVQNPSDGGVLQAVAGKVCG